MKRVTIAEFIDEFMTDLDSRIVTLSENHIDALIKEMHDDPEMIKPLLLEVEKRRDNYFRKQKHYDYTAFKRAAMYLIIIIALAYLWYFIAINYFIPFQKELEILIKKLEPLGITFIEGKTQSASYFKEISENTHLTPSQYITARDIMDQICYVNAKLHSILIKSIHSGIIASIIAFAIMVYREIRNCIWPQYKKRYETYCLIEQKLREVTLPTWQNQ